MFLFMKIYTVCHKFITVHEYLIKIMDILSVKENILAYKKGREK